MVKLTLYGIEISPPVRAVKLTLAALNLPYDFVKVDLMGRAHILPDFLKKNPQHTVPTLEDDGHYLWDSHAIIAYLVSKYADSDSLYPKDLLQRAVVDQRLHFESGVVFADGLRSISKPVLFLNQKVVPKERKQAIIEIYDFVETFLKDQDYIAGNQLTIADFSLISTITSLDVLVTIDHAKYARVSAWIKRLKELPYYEEANGKGIKELIPMFKKTNFTFASD
ncbi:glutathione S-transferase 1-like [Drosophila guanche]|uniref:Blast:Glutathione S-transferase 1 n=1 Tax=Drosophila guanche TaxID=7266 RepID=A0A3B0J7I3_DROGU|nr:glutathione S-transferase 1-like [Drosophila guanche]SPP75872.1 blast:Glutathione S-transferase 1 [Drosophila guanche]